VTPADQIQRPVMGDQAIGLASKTTAGLTNVLPTAVRWTAAEVYSIHAAGLEDLADEAARMGHNQIAVELARLAVASRAALDAEREAQR
jgi:hypothetical protein